MTEVKTPFLRSRQRRGRWFHTYRRDGREISLGVHGLPPDDPRVISAYEVTHRNFMREAPKAGTLAHAWEGYAESEDWKGLATGSRKMRSAILRGYVKRDGPRPLATIATADIEAALATLKPHARGNHAKALRGLFKWAKAHRWITRDPTAGMDWERVKTKGFPTATPEHIAAFRAHWPEGTTERLVFDLALHTGAARTDLAKIGPVNVQGDVLTYRRKKSGSEAYVPMTRELRSVIKRALAARSVVPLGEDRPFILQPNGRPFAPESLGNRMGDAAKAAGLPPRVVIHALRKAFCVMWAERGKSAHEIAAMSGHITLAEVQRYCAEADRRRMAATIAATER